MELRLDKALAKEVWKTYGAVSTPVYIVDFMIKALGVETWQGLKILEPGCGFCDFLTRICEKYPFNEFAGVEVNHEVYDTIVGLYPHFKLIYSDFLLWETEERYDIVIGNPPYGIIGDKSHYPIHILKEKKKAYKRRSGTWHGKYNIYGAFIEKGLKLLEERGKLAFIVPATFMILDDFKLLRKFLAITGKTKVFYLGPRMFKDKSVSTAVLVVNKGQSGIELYDAEGLKEPIQCYSRDNYDGDIIKFTGVETERFEEGAAILGDLFSFHFAARSPEVKKHPSVRKEAADGLVPILTGRNLHSGWIDYEHCYSGFWMPREVVSSLRSFYTFPHIVVGHTKGGKLVAAIDDRGYPWREDIHLVPKVDGIDIQKICQYLNSSEVQTYMRKLYKEITPHVTITQLKRLPVKNGEEFLVTRRNKRLDS